MKANVSGHVRLVKRARGDQYYVKYRLRSGRQIQKRLGPAWKERGRPPEGYFTRKMAEQALQAILTDARRGEIPDPEDRSGKTFGEACAAWLHYVEHDRERAASTLRDYRNTVRGSLIPALGEGTPLDQITTETIDSLRERLLAEGRLSRRSVQKALVLLHGILKLAKRRKWISANPAEDAERVSVRRSGDFNLLDAEQIYAVARAAESEQDAALFTVAAFSGLRMGELRALSWRDVDFPAQTIFVRASYTAGAIGPPKSGKIRSVPLIDQAARALDGLSRRELHTEPDDLVFPSPTGGHEDDSRGEIISRAEQARRAPPCQAFVSPPEARESMKRREREHKEEGIALLEALGVKA